MSYSVVWFKRDLRLHDHAALHAASLEGPLLCLYVIEPGLWRQPDLSSQHYDFTRECLDDLARSLAQRGIPLMIRVGEVVEVLAALHAAAPFKTLHAHEETGNGFTYARDMAVARWCRSQGVVWKEHRQTGVIRRLASRDGWAASWEQFVAQPCLPVPVIESITPPLDSQAAPAAATLVSHRFEPPRRQRGGRREGIAVFQDFLRERSQQYRGGISSPLSAPTACSRISPYLAMGCLSLREIVQGTRRQLDRLPLAQKQQRLGLEGFISRLHWHCHFMQKLESEPEIEWRNMHRGYDGLREDDHDDVRFRALCEGRTGWPLVDACVAMLNDTGWLNFRMRAMLVSVAAYPLWLHWRPVGLWLARSFLDYEPGIHWSQLQMQSGTTGINTTRVYNPVKQARDHDPDGYFVRRWLPAMRRVPDAWLFEPWRMPEDLLARSEQVQDSPAIIPPIVDLEDATREAKARLYARRGDALVREGKRAVLEKHGSRQIPLRAKAGRRNRRPSETDQPQLDLL